MEDAEQLKNIAVDFYSKLLIVDPLTREEYMRQCFPPLSANMKLRLNEVFTLEDTRRALMKMSSLKAPGPDGFQPVFLIRHGNLLKEHSKNSPEASSKEETSRRKQRRSYLSQFPNKSDQEHPQL